MKKLLLIVLIACICIGVTDTALLAEVRFGSWKKWNESLPPYKLWDTLILDKPSCFLRPAGFIGGKGEVFENLFWVMNLYFCNSRECSERMSMILFSPINEKPDFRNDFICDYDLALAVFPPEEEMVRVMAYIKVEGKKELRFFEEWEIPYENQHPIIQSVEFAEEFRKWIEKRNPVPSFKVDKENLRLVIFDEKNFTVLLTSESKNKEFVKQVGEVLKKK